MYTGSLTQVINEGVVDTIKSIPDKVGSKVVGWKASHDASQDALNDFLYPKDPKKKRKEFTGYRSKYDYEKKYKEKYKQAFKDMKADAFRHGIKRTKEGLDTQTHPVII